MSDKADRYLAMFLEAQRLLGERGLTWNEQGKDPEVMAILGKANSEIWMSMAPDEQQETHERCNAVRMYEKKVSLE